MSNHGDDAAVAAVEDVPDAENGGMAFDDEAEGYDGGEAWHEHDGAGNTGGDGDEEDDDGDLEILHADHPALARVQAALKRQLTRRKAEVDDELRELKAQAKARTAEREAVGVQLYNAQQQLARLQMQLEGTNDRCSEAMAKRTQLDEALAVLREEHATAKDALAARQADADAAQAEHDRLSGQVLMLERHADELASKLKGARRAASKVSQLQDKREETKQKQDLYVDRLSERIKELERDITIAKKQREAQATETKSALEALREAQMEVEDIAMRRREINTLWQASTAGLAKRNDALAEMQATVTHEQQELFAKEREVENCERRIRDEQEKNETLSSQLLRLQTELASVKKKLEATLVEQDRLKREYSMITRALQETEDNLQRVRQQVNIASSELNIARDKVDRLSNTKTALENSLVNKMQDKLTVDHASRGTAKSIEQLRKRMAEQEAELAQVENLVARSNLDASDIEARLEGLRADEAQLKTESSELANMVEEAQKATKRNYTTIERKQAQVDQLNRRCDMLRTKLQAEGAGKEDLTPGMIEVASYRRDITSLDEENRQLQQRWLSQQSELVALERTIEERTDEADMLRNKHSVLGEQQRRIDGDIEARRREVAQQERVFRGLQTELLKLNRLVTRNRGVQQELQQSNVLLETDFLRQLKGEERECADLQTRYEGLQEERERLLNAVIEAEEQMLLWEKKITLARETKAELKSNEGKEELDGMRAEIHRMELRMTQLERQKEELITEMERSVERREHIGTKARLAAKKPSTDAAHTVKKEVADLQRRLQLALKDAKQFEEHISVVVQEQTEVKGAIESTRGAQRAARDQRGQVESDLHAGLRAKVRNLDDLVHYQAMVKHFQAAEARKLKLKFKEADAYEAGVEKQVQVLQSLNMITDYLSKENEALVPELDNIRSLINLRLERQHGAAPSVSKD